MLGKRSIKFLILTMTTSAVMASDVGAALFNPMVVTDTQLKLLASVDFMGPLAPADRIRVDNDPLTAGLTSLNWFLDVRQERVDSPAPAAANDIEVEARHIRPPAMPPHGEGRGPLVMVADFLNVTPGTTVRDAQGMVAIHAFSGMHGNHRDFLQARIDRLGAGVSRISIQADHSTGARPPPVPMVPIPAAAPLLASALGLLALLRRRPAPITDVTAKPSGAPEQNWRAAPPGAAFR